MNAAPECPNTFPALSVRTVASVLPAIWLIFTAVPPESPYTPNWVAVSVTVPKHNPAPTTATLSALNDPQIPTPGKVMPIRAPLVPNPLNPANRPVRLTPTVPKVVPTVPKVVPTVPKVVPTSPKVVPIFPEIVTPTGVALVTP